MLTHDPSMGTEFQQVKLYVAACNGYTLSTGWQHCASVQLLMSKGFRASVVLAVWLSYEYMMCAA